MHFTGFDRRIWRYLDLERTKPRRNNVSRGVCWVWKLWKFSDGLIFSMQRRCSKKPPTLSCCDFAPEINSISQHRTGSNKSPVLCSGFMERVLEFQAWDGSVGVWVCTPGCAQPQVIHKPQRNASKKRNCHPHSPSILPFSASSPSW